VSWARALREPMIITQRRLQRHAGVEFPPNVIDQFDSLERPASGRHPLDLCVGGAFWLLEGLSWRAVSLGQERWVAVVAVHLAKYTVAFCPKNTGWSIWRGPPDARIGLRRHLDLPVFHGGT